jgi:hypothetical protein
MRGSRLLWIDSRLLDSARRVVFSAGSFIAREGLTLSSFRASPTEGPKG